MKRNIVFQSAAQTFIAGTVMAGHANATVSGTVVIHRSIIYQSQFHVPEKIVSITPQGFESESPQVRTRPTINAAQQQFGSFCPQGSIVSTTPQGNQAQSPELFQSSKSLGPSKPIGVEQQQFAAYSPMGNVPTKFIPDGTQDFDTIPSNQLRRPYQITLQQFAAYSPRGNIPTVFIPDGTQDFDPIAQLARKLFRSELQQFSTYPPQGTVPTVTPPTEFIESPQAFTKPYKASLQQFGAYPPRGNVPTVFVPDGTRDFDPAPILKPFNAALQQFRATGRTPQAVASTPITSGVQPWDPPQLVKPFVSVLFQDFTSGEVYPPVAGATGQVASSSGGTIIVNRSVVYQSNFRSPVVIVAAATTPPLPKAEFQERPGPYPICVIADFAGAASTPAFFTAGIQPWDPLPARRPIQQHVLGYVTQPTAQVSNTVTWSTSQWPDFSVCKVVKASQQPFTSFGPAGIIISITPQGWASQHPTISLKPYNSALQQFSLYSPMGNVPTVTPPTEWSESQQLYVSPYRASLQQFQTLGPFVPIPGTPTTGPLTFSISPDPTHPPRLPAWQQQFQCFAPAGTIVSVTPQGWYGPWPDASRAKLAKIDNWSTGLPAFPQVYGAFPPFEVALRPRRVILDVQAFATQPSAAVQVAFGSPGWWDALTPQKRLVVFLSQHSTLPPSVPIPPAITPSRFFALEWPYSIKRPLWPDLMPFGLFEGQVIIPGTKIFAKPQLLGNTGALPVILTNEAGNPLTDENGNVLTTDQPGLRLLASKQNPTLKGKVDK